MAENRACRIRIDSPPATASESRLQVWRAESEAGQPLGMIQLRQRQPWTAEVCEMQASDGCRRSLLEAALGVCLEKGYLKLTLHTAMPVESVLPLFERFHYRAPSRQPVGGRTSSTFYLDLYSADRTKAPAPQPGPRRHALEPIGWPEAELPLAMTQAAGLEEQAQEITGV